MFKSLVTAARDPAQSAKLVLLSLLAFTALGGVMLVFAHDGLGVEQTVADDFEVDHDLTENTHGLGGKDWTTVILPGGGGVREFDCRTDDPLGGVFHTDENNTILTCDDHSQGSAIDSSVFAESDKVFDLEYDIKCGNVPKKNDEANVYFSLRENGDEYLVAAMEILDVNGDSHRNFQVLHAQLEQDFPSTCPHDTNVQITRTPRNSTAGDIAVAVDASGGGAELTVRVFEWLEPGSPGYNVGANESSPLGNPDPDDCPNNALAPNGGCWDLVPTNGTGVIATINYDGDFGQSKNVTTNDPEDVDDEIAAEFPSVVCERVTGGNNTQCQIKPNLPQRGFVEIAVNLTELDLEPEGCQGFGTMWTETRASDSLLSQLKDITEMESLVPVCSTILTKEASADTVHVGDDVTYTYIEENDGTVPLFNVSVSDDKCSPVNPVLDGGHNVGDDNDNDDLDPGEAWEFACTLTITESMGDTITNTAIGHGFDAFGLEITFCDDPGTVDPEVILCDADERAQATVEVIHPSTMLTKQASATTVHSGESVTYTYTEENDGDVDLVAPIFVEDDECAPVTPVLDSGHNVGDTDDDDELDVGETWTFTCTLDNITSDVTNTAISHGVDPLGFDVTWNATDCSVTGDLLGTPDRFCDADETAQATVVVLDPSTSLTKEAAVTVTYLYRETNDGGEDLVGPIFVEDDSCSPVTDLDMSPADGFNDGDVNTDDVLNVGETWVFICTTDLSAFLSADDSLQFLNIAIGHAIDSLGFDVTWADGCVSTGDLLQAIFCDMDEETGLQIDIDVSDPLAP